MSSPVENDPSSDNWVCTQTRGDRIEFEWKIKKFHQLLQKNRENVTSPIFPSDSKNEQWKVRIYPRDKQDDVEWLSVYLVPSSDKMHGINVKCKFIIFQLNQVLVTDEFSYKYNRNGYGFLKFIKRSELSVQNDPTDTITIYCRIDILGTYITSSSEDKSSNRRILFETRKNRLTEDYQSFYKNSSLTDFTVISGDKKFPTHKAILASRSPVFAAMFEHKEVKENIENEMKIENIDPAVVEGLLEFMYTDDVSEIRVLAHGLLEAAEQYGVEGLKNLCEETLYKGLNEDNAAELLALADLHHAHQLKKYVMQFIVDHPKKVAESEAFNSVELSGELSKEIIRALIFTENNEDSSDGK